MNFTRRFYFAIFLAAASCGSDHQSQYDQRSDVDAGPESGQVRSDFYFGGARKGAPGSLNISTNLSGTTGSATQSTQGGSDESPTEVIPHVSDPSEMATTNMNNDPSFRQFRNLYIGAIFEIWKEKYLAHQFALRLSPGVVLGAASQIFAQNSVPHAVLGVAGLVASVGGAVSTLPLTRFDKLWDAFEKKFGFDSDDSRPDMYSPERQKIENRARETFLIIRRGAVEPDPDRPIQGEIKNSAFEAFLSIQRGAEKP